MDLLFITIHYFVYWFVASQISFEAAVVLGLADIAIQIEKYVNGVLDPDEG